MPTLRARLAKATDPHVRSGPDGPRRDPRCRLRQREDSRRRRPRHLGGHGRRHRHNLDEFPYPIEDNSFDQILLQDVIEHVADPYRVFAELHRIARPAPASSCAPRTSRRCSRTAIRRTSSTSRPSRSARSPSRALRTTRRSGSARCTSPSTSGCRSASSASPRSRTASRSPTRPTSHSAIRR